MGSQARYNRLYEAPAAIVLEGHGEGFYIATRSSSSQPDNFGGGRGPVVVVYEVARGRPYLRKTDAAIDCALILARSDQ